mmetsp:Transcript_33953/g.61545  ORF Transcript_33953/g.61545 Transcript_33953/m.61545 type:complete len:226 (-) Transcript_33953:460-1137(-)
MARCIPEFPDERERFQERPEHKIRKLHCVFQHAFPWLWFGTGKVCEPMHEVECNISFRCSTLLDKAAESFEERPWRGFCLHEPSIVESHLSLSEQDGLPGFGVKVCIARQGGRIVHEHVGKGDVVISDLNTSCMAFELPVLLGHNRQQGLNLHDVMDCCEYKHGLRSRDIMRPPSLAIFLQDSCLTKQILDFLPAHLAVEVQLLLILTHRSICDSLRKVNLRLWI